jgi:gliding motility-associated-like protein
MRNYIVFTLIAFVLSLFHTASAQYWMQQGGGLTIDESADIAVDNSGNSYTVGYFTGSATFGTTTLTSSGSTDIFLVKTNDQGVVQWAVSAGGTGSDKGLSVAVDDSGNPYITGFYNGTASFSTTSLTSAGLQDVFVAKYTTAGVLSWAISAGGVNADIGNGIAVDGSGNAAIAGEFKGSATFGTSTLSSQSGSTDVFVMHVSSTGTVNWIQQGAGANTDRGIDVAFDLGGNVYATGAFSQSITFDVLHTNTMFNVIFLIKLNNLGVEQWFKIIGGGSSNIVNALTSDSSGNIYATGDFTGTMTFFNNPNTTLSATNTNRVFVVKYTPAGATSWSAANSSENDLTSQAIAVDGNENVYITGHFKCTHTEFTTQYGDAIFNSIGDNDVYVSKFDNTGTWDYAKHFGGRGEDFGYGIDAKINNQAHICGSYDQAMYFPVSANFISTNISNFTASNCTGNDGYCGDADYGKFRGTTTSGNADAFFANPVDPNREPYDFYERSGTSCVKDILPPCINTGCPDTVSNCQSVFLQAFLDECDDIRPSYNYQWNGIGVSPNNTTTVNTSGIKTVSKISVDGCHSAIDTIYVEISPAPTKPTVTDNKGVNTNSSFPQIIEVCSPDTVILTAGNLAGNTFQWTGPGIGTVTDTTISVTQTGTYTVSVTDSNGCNNSTNVNVSVFAALAPFILSSTATDTMQICSNEQLTFHLFDSIANPGASPNCFSALPYNTSTQLTFTPSTLFAFANCGSQISMNITDTITFTMTARLIRSSPCQDDTIFYTKKVFVDLLQAPTIPFFNILINGSNYFCPGDSALWVATDGPNYSWSGPGISGSYTSDSIYLNTPGQYQVYGDTSDTAANGCITTQTDVTIKNLQEKQSPQIQTTNTLICPNSFVTLTADFGATQPYNDTVYFWEGPNGPISNGNLPTIDVTDPGQYFCVVMDADSCGLVSNTVTLTQYTTPQLVATGDLFICENDSLTLSVISNAGSLIQWQSPLSGSGTSITVYEPGVYSCMIEACNIQTFDTLEVFPSYVNASITQSGVLCTGDTIVLYAPDSMITFTWGPNGETSDSILVNSNGSFWLSTTDSNGCSAQSDTIDIVNNQIPTVVQISEDSVLCIGDTITITATSGMSSYLWQPTGDTNQTALITEKGTYSVYSIDSNGCDDFSNQIVISTPDTFINTRANGDLNFCEGDSVELEARQNGFASYTWNPGNISEKTIVVYQTDTYQLTVVDTFGCVAKSIVYPVFAEPNLINTPVGLDTIICAGTVANLSVNTNMGEIEWLDSLTGDRLGIGPDYTTDLLYETTSFLVWSNSVLCKSDSGIITVYVDDCDTVGVPNIFTPNGDGVNDVFRMTLIKNTCFRGYIFNRWGGLMFESGHINTGWDGTIQGTGEAAAEGTYFFMFEYCKFDGTAGTREGTVTLLRN